MRTLVIAEAGSTHENNLRAALDLISIAKQAGADICKWQYWSSSKLLAEQRRMPQNESKYAAYKLSREWLPILKEESDKVGIEFACSVFLEEDIPIIEPFVKRFKVSAFETCRNGFISAHYKYNKPIIASLNPGSGCGPFARDKVKWLHCISDYPADMKDLQLSYVGRLDGFSDHSGHIRAGAYAVAAGAKIVEAHFKNYFTPPNNPDYPHSHDPMSLRGYVDLIREAEVTL